MSFETGTSKANSTIIDSVTQSITPSHVLADGSNVILPPPTLRERGLFLERSLARHGLLQEDIEGKKDEDVEEEMEAPKKDEHKEPTIHPLALASARLQVDGINELNRAINLSSIQGHYFGMSNILDPSSEPQGAPSSSKVDKSKNDSIKPSSSLMNSSTVPAGSAPHDVQQEQRTKATFVLKQKRAQFAKAAKDFARHKRRLELSVVAQARPDERLRQLRKQWRIVAPEHGVRALPHAVRATETIACDVDLYVTRNLGRQASHVPRFATMELKADYDVKTDVQEWKNRLQGGERIMDVDTIVGDGNTESKESKLPGEHIWTMAEPFSIPNPELGKVDIDVDPKKPAMLSLQLDIEKPSTGFCQSALLQPVSVIDKTDQRENGGHYQDEQVLVALQHSMLCATLFESIRRELAPDTEDIGKTRTSNAQSDVWLPCESETNFLPPPSVMSGEKGSSALAPLSVIHCHEGEVKVQLDCEYTLKIKLVEARDPKLLAETKSNGTSDDAKFISGSHSPEQLLFLCRILLIDAQERFHKHSIRSAAQAKERAASAGPDAHARKIVETSPLILQHCCALGSKILFAQKIRATIVDVNGWLATTSNTEERLRSEWLSYSLFDLQAQLVVTFRSLVLDCTISCEELTVTSINDNGDYKKVKFHSDVEFELFLKMAIQKLMKQ